jgi:hypothetical protein
MDETSKYWEIRGLFFPGHKDIPKAYINLSTGRIDPF